jgi:hypothetical protein
LAGEEVEAIVDSFEPLEKCGVALIEGVQAVVELLLPLIEDPEPCFVRLVVHSGVLSVAVPVRLSAGVVQSRTSGWTCHALTMTPLDGIARVTSVVGARRTRAESVSKVGRA